MAPVKYHFFENLPADKTAESFETVLQRPGLTVERIVSNGHCSPDHFWYEQETDEWVLVLSGSATLVFSSAQDTDTTLLPVTLCPGEAIFIAAGERHRVVSTEAGKPTVWLAIHLDPAQVAN